MPKLINVTNILKKAMSIQENPVDYDMTESEPPIFVDEPGPEQPQDRRNIALPQRMLMTLSLFGKAMKEDAYLTGARRIKHVSTILQKTAKKCNPVSDIADNDEVMGRGASRMGRGLNMFKARGPVKYKSKKKGSKGQWVYDYGTKKTSRQLKQKAEELGPVIKQKIDTKFAAIKTSVSDVINKLEELQKVDELGMHRDLIRDIRGTFGGITKHAFEGKQSRKSAKRIFDDLTKKVNKRLFQADTREETNAIGHLLQAMQNSSMLVKDLTTYHDRKDYQTDKTKKQIAYAREQEKPPVKFEGALDLLMGKSIVPVLPLAKSNGRKKPVKYKSRKKGPGGKWIYDYGEKKEKFTPSSTEQIAKKVFEEMSPIEKTDFDSTKHWSNVSNILAAEGIQDSRKTQEVVDKLQQMGKQVLTRTFREHKNSIQGAFPRAQMNSFLLREPDKERRTLYAMKRHEHGERLKDSVRKDAQAGYLNFRAKTELLKLIDQNMTGVNKLLIQANEMHTSKEKGDRGTGKEYTESDFLKKR